MNTQTDLLRKTLEGISTHGAARVMNPDEKEIRATYEKQAKEIADDLLELFPEEENDHVEAYRALMTLVDYSKKHNLQSNGAFFRDELPVEQQLLRLRRQIEEPAKKSVVERLEVEDSSPPMVGISTKQIYDPISKMSRSLSTPPNLEEESIEQQKKYLAHEVLEEPV